MPVTWIEHNNHKILYVDYREAKTADEALAILEEEVSIVRKESEQVNLLADFRGANVDSDFMSQAKKYGKEVLNPKTNKGAILGISGAKKILLKAYNAFSGDKLSPFDTEQEAKDYLAS